MRLRIDRQPRVLLLDGPEERIDLRQRVDLVAEQLDPIGVLIVRRVDLDDVASHAERPALEVDVVAFVQDLDQPPRDVFTPQLLGLFRSSSNMP